MDETQVQSRFNILSETFNKCVQESRTDFEYYSLMSKIFGTNSNSPKEMHAASANSALFKSSSETKCAKKRRCHPDLERRWLTYLERAQQLEEAQIAYWKRKGEIDEMKIQLKKQKIQMMKKMIEEKENRIREEGERRKEEIEHSREKIRLLKELADKSRS